MSADDDNLDFRPRLGWKGLALAVIAVSAIAVLVLAPRLPRSRLYRTLVGRSRIVSDANWISYPVGFPHAQGYYVALEFGEDRHLGEDWNGLDGGDSDLGQPVCAIFEGEVLSAGDAGPGWGNVVLIKHRVEEPERSFEVVSLYGHLRDLKVEAGDAVKTGAEIGTIGNANGRYLAHLHFEIRTDVTLPIGGGYGSATGFVAPSEFIAAHRRRLQR